MRFYSVESHPWPQYSTVKILLLADAKKHRSRHLGITIIQQIYEQYMLLFNTHKGMHHSLVAGKVGRREGPMRPKAREMAQHGGPPGCVVGGE
jgi:hypothetical protein